MMKLKFAPLVLFLAILLLIAPLAFADDRDDDQDEKRRGLKHRVEALENLVNDLSAEVSGTEALWANVHADGILTGGNGVVSLNKSTELLKSIYTIEFFVDISLCAVTSSPSSPSMDINPSGSSVVVTIPSSVGSNFGIAVHCDGTFISLPPTTGVVSLSPSGNVTALDVLTCSSTGSVDSDGNPVENHDFAFTNGTSRFPRSGQTSASAQVNQLFSPGAMVGCEARANLGDPLPMVGEWVASPEQATVLNTPPTLISVEIFFITNVIQCRPDFTDPDYLDFSPTRTTNWFVNEAPYTPRTHPDALFLGVDVNSGDKVACELQLTDKFGGTSALVGSPDATVP
jgi:hypothetical protein